MKNKGMYHNVYILKDGQYISLADDAVAFCRKWIKPVRKDNWNWVERDLDKPENDPTIAEARAIRELVFKDLKKSTATIVDLSTSTNADALIAFFDPKSKDEEFNMQEFAEALKVELEHGKFKDVNVTNNHPFLTAMIVLAHMTESLSYYKRLKIMEIEAKILEIMRKLKTATSNKPTLIELLQQQEDELITAREELAKRLEIIKKMKPLEEV